MSDDAVLTLDIQDGLLFCGLQGSDIKVFDLETFQLIRVLRGHTDDILSLTSCGAFILSGSVDGTVRVWNKNLMCCGMFPVSPGHGIPTSPPRFRFGYNKQIHYIG